MRKFALGGLVTLVMLSFGALAQAEGPIFHIIDGTCGLFDATGYISEVTGLHVTSSTDPDGNTNLHCNATLPLDAGATAASGKPVVWDANSCDDLPVADPPGSVRGDVRSRRINLLYDCWRRADQRLARHRKQLRMVERIVHVPSEMTFGSRPAVGDGLGSGSHCAQIRPHDLTRLP